MIFDHFGLDLSRFGAEYELIDDLLSNEIKLLQGFVFI